MSGGLTGDMKKIERAGSEDLTWAADIYESIYADLQEAGKHGASQPAVEEAWAAIESAKEVFNLAYVNVATAAEVLQMLAKELAGDDAGTADAIKGLDGELYSQAPH